MTAKRTVDREEEIIFTNWTAKDFEHTWAKKIYRFAAGKSYYLPFYLAEHFAKHLVDRELNEQKKPTNGPERQSMIDKCVTILAPGEPGVVKPREVPIREVKLATEERREQQIQAGHVNPADIPGRRHNPKAELVGVKDAPEALAFPDLNKDETTSPAPTMTPEPTPAPETTADTTAI